MKIELTTDQRDEVVREELERLSGILRQDYERVPFYSYARKEEKKWKKKELKALERVLTWYQ